MADNNRIPTSFDDPSVLAEQILGAATQHGEDSDPDMEVGDLQIVLRRAIGLMTTEQRARLIYDITTVDELFETEWNHYQGEQEEEV